MVSYKIKKEPYGCLVGDWQISSEYICPFVGYNSKLASAEDLIGKTIRIYYDNNQLLIDWEGEQYYLKQKNNLDKDKFSQTYILRTEEALSKYDFPISEYVFRNDNAILTSIMVLIDKKANIYVRFNDIIG